MIISPNISLRKYNSFGIDVTADRLIHITSENEAINIFRNRKKLNEPFFILGGGSNILFLGNYNGTIIRPEIEDIRTEKSEKDYLIISAGAGVLWDDLVKETVENGLGGMENLSLIPGTVGATPVQNIGAYGVEVSELITRVDTVNTNDGSIQVFNNMDCKFGYRTSIFKKEARGEFLITRVYYRLSRRPEYRLGYGSVKDELEKTGNLTLKKIRQAIINIRRRKLPDPDISGNAGSFFKNPVITEDSAEQLTFRYPGIPVYDDKPGYKKIAAGWLIEQCGWKGIRKGDAGVHEMQSLVLVNYGHATGKDIFELSEEIKQSVKEKFDLTLEREVELAGFI